MKIYAVLVKNKKRWKIAVTVVGSLAMPNTRFSKKEAVDYCKLWNNLVSGEKIFDFIGIEVPIRMKKGSGGGNGSNKKN